MPGMPYRCVIPSQDEETFMKQPAIIVLACLVSSTFCPAASAVDWPMYQREVTRSGVTDEQPVLPLSELWVHKSQHAPQPAWPAPAKQDFWHELRELRPTVTYDRAFHTAVVGETLYFGSSADDKVYALDTASGEIRWEFYTEGPVRLAPNVANGKVYVGSDDGWVYCLKAEDGTLLWKHRPYDEERRIPGNGRVISTAPVRTGVLVDNGIAYYCAGLFPSREVFCCALDAESGEEIYCEQLKNVSPQGYLLASPTRLFVPAGRTTPAILNRENAEYLGSLEGNGGAYAILAGDTVASGPGRRSGNELQIAEADTRESIASFPGIRMVVKGDMAYLQSKDTLSALNRVQLVAIARERKPLRDQFNALRDPRKQAERDGNEAEVKRLDAEMAALEKAIAEKSDAMKACFLWEQRCDHPYALILAGDTLYAGGEGEIIAVNTADGDVLWEGEVLGKAHGLSVANGSLFVSTDAGAIHCFAPGTVEREHVVAPGREPFPYPEDKLTPAYAEAAAHIVSRTGITQGYCIVLDCGEGRLAYELAKHTELRIVGLEANARKVAAARKALDQAGLYGQRVSIRHWKDKRLPFSSQFANLIVDDAALTGGKITVPATEVMRVLRPYGGTAIIGRPGSSEQVPRALTAWLGDTGEVVKEDGVWAVMQKGIPEGAGEWTQLYATPNHTACSDDTLRGPMAVQWFGEPGPRDIIDRHHRPMSSLFKDGRVFIPANDLVITADAYNGAPLWKLEVPNSRRVGALKNSGHMLLTDKYLYVAVEDECWAVNVADGTHAFTLKAPQLAKDHGNDWGYLNCIDDQLFGTGQRQGASFNRLAKATVNLLEGDFRPVMVSEYLFSVDRHSGKKLWTYRKGAIMNNAIAIDDGRIYFIESRNDRAMADDDGRMRIDYFCGGEAYLVALDIKSGKKRWERPIELPYEHIMFLNGKNDTLLASGTFNKGEDVFYAMFAFRMEDGEALWQNEYQALDVRAKGFAGTGGSHGEQWQHPVLIGDAVYSRPFAFELATGKKLDYMNYRGGHGCGGLSGSAYYLYGRGDNPRMYPTETKETEGIRLTHVSRPGCWLNIIPAGGLLIVPESSSGCTCDYPLQTSLAFIPESLSGEFVTRDTAVE
jgi:outer membrane protein assembly factor BamB